jgi:flagellar hook-length control protein FliK
MAVSADQQPSATTVIDTEMPTTQALPAGTLQQVNSAEHSVRVQLHTEALGRLTADLHTRPGEMAVQLTVPDDAGRALMAQRMDALRDSLGQSGTAVHLSLTAHDTSQEPQSYQGFSTSQGQQGNTPREDRAQAPSAPQPHDAVTPRATDGSSVLPAPAGGSRLVDVRA